jgi:hypothetical protein
MRTLIPFCSQQADVTASTRETSPGETATPPFKPSVQLPALDARSYSIKVCLQESANETNPSSWKVVKGLAADIAVIIESHESK